MAISTEHDKVVRQVKNLRVRFAFTEEPLYCDHYCFGHTVMIPYGYLTLLSKGTFTAL